mmetsp:Transcript_25046/g.24519  ORF Transcript_25046/g.24519 Transcript_25046/m.24519 type:complete len:98 (+) Transcript_25046:33-326(+)
MVYFGLNKESVPDDGLKVQAGRREFKSFCKLNALNKKTFFEIHCYAFRFLYLLWSRERFIEVELKEKPAFHMIMEEMRDFVTKLMYSSFHCKNILEF